MFTYKTYFDSKECIWYGKKVDSIFNYNISVGQVLLTMLKRDDEKIVQISDNSGIHLSANDIYDLSIRIAKNLQNKGLQQEDVIGLIAENSHFIAPLAIAAFLCGMPLNALDTAFNEDEIKHLFTLTKPKIVFCDISFYSKVKNVLKDLSSKNGHYYEIFTIDGIIDDTKSIHEFLTGNSDDFIPPILNHGGDQICAILCSSGSTGMPKGISVSHAMILQLPLRMSPENKIMLCFSPLHWISGLRTLINGIIFGSTRIIINKQFTPELALNLIEKYKITWFLSSPTHMTLISECSTIQKYDLSSLLVYTCGGDLIPKEIIKEILKYFKNCRIIVVYGLSEIAGRCSIGNVLDKEGSVGQLLHNFQVKIINKNGEKLNHMKQGEICIKPPYKLLGYYGNLLATNDTIDNNGWLHTDDIGYFDNDNFLFLIDRRIDEIKYKNHYIWTSHLEEYLRQIPEISDVCAFGIRNSITTELPAAAVIIKKNFIGKITKEMILKFIKSKLLDYQYLRGGIYFYDAFPLTTSGKIIRRKIRNECEQIFYNNNECENHILK